MTLLLEDRQMKIPKQAYTREFKELAVKRVKDGQALAGVAKELGLVEQTLRNWVKAAASGKLNGAGSKAVTPEEREFSRLRAENLRKRSAHPPLGTRNYTGFLSGNSSSMRLFGQAGSFAKVSVSQAMGSIPFARAVSSSD